jgi:hypothetical protein
MTLNDDCMRMIYRKRETRSLQFDQVLDSPIHHFHQVPDLSHQRTFFGFFHTDEKICLHVITCMRNRHSTMIVDIIEWCDDRDQREKAMMSHFKKR